MFRKLSFVAIASMASWMAQGNLAQADHYSHGHNHCSSYRPQVAYYGVPNYNAYRYPTYSGNVGYPLYSGGYSGLSYYGSGYGPGYGSSFNAPFGGYGMGGFPRNGSYGGGGGFSLNIGR
ncbi:MAG: hypothetical protein SGI77_00705 [Pirellulaceae bacterium]|nr:hypothetical protein [Pirellulaceae bacterium]